MRGRRLMLPAAVAVTTLLACGYTGEASLDVAGLGPDGSSSTTDLADGADAADAADATDLADGFVSVPIGCSPPSCALPTVPAGWNLVLLEDALTDPCPGGFGSADVVENPTATASACSCAACVTSGTNCSTGAIPTAYDTGDGKCGTNGAQHQTNNGACRAQSGNFGQNARVDAPTAVRGTCTSQASLVPANVASQPRRVCARAADTCPATACGAPGSMKSCIATPGDVACPAGVSTKHLVGSGVTATCPPCGCSIASATCGGSLSFYPQSNCAGTPVTLPVGTCKGTGGASFLSTKWTPLVASEQCVTTPLAPKVALAGTQTICCP